MKTLAMPFPSPGSILTRKGGLFKHNYFFLHAFFEIWGYMQENPWVTQGQSTSTKLQSEFPFLTKG